MLDGDCRFLQNKYCFVLIIINLSVCNHITDIMEFDSPELWTLFDNGIDDSKIPFLFPESEIIDNPSVFTSSSKDIYDDIGLLLLLCIYSNYATKRQFQSPPNTDSFNNCNYINN